MDQLPDAHDSFFRFAISRIDCARNLIASQLSAEALAMLDLDTLQPAPDSFVDSSLRKRFSDLAFLVKLRPGDSTRTERPEAAKSPQEADRKHARHDDSSALTEAIVCVLFEHKSSDEQLTVLQLLGYIVRIWEKRLRDGLPLIPIIPLVVYHGPTPWSAPRSIDDLVPCPEAIRPYQVAFQFPILDLRSTRDFLLTEAGNPAIDSILQSVLLLLKYSRDEQLVRRLRPILAGLAISFHAQRLTEQQLNEWLEAIERYVMSTSKHIEAHQFEQKVCEFFPTSYEPGSPIDKAITAGEKKGRQEGRVEGRGEGVLVGQIRLLQSLLGSVETPEEELYKMEATELQEMIDSLKAKLAR